MAKEDVCPCCRTTERPEEERKKLINRLSRIEGQIRGIKSMIERDAYCADVLTQSAAAGAALSAFNRELLASHVEHCVVRDIRAGKDDAAPELVALVEKLLR